MTYVLVPRCEGESSESAGLAAAGSEEPFASDVALWDWFFDLVGSQRSERPEVWTLASLAWLAGTWIGNEFSDWGCEPSHGVWKPDMCASGDWIYSAGLVETHVPEPGTSMAAPVVAGRLDLSGI